MHPIQQLVATHVRGSGVMTPAPRGMLHPAFARYGSGCDHLGGEVPLAYLDSELPRGYTLTYVVTDRRLVGRVHASNVSETFTDIVFPYVTSTRVEGGMLTKKLLVQVGPRLEAVYGFSTMLEPFFRGLLTLPPEHRSFPPLQFHPTEQ